MDGVRNDKEGEGILCLYATMVGSLHLQNEDRKKSDRPLHILLLLHFITALS